MTWTSERSGMASRGLHHRPDAGDHHEGGGQRGPEKRFPGRPVDERVEHGSVRVRCQRGSRSHRSDHPLARFPLDELDGDLAPRRDVLYQRRICQDEIIFIAGQLGLATGPWLTVTAPAAASTAFRMPSAWCPTVAGFVSFRCLKAGGRLQVAFGIDESWRKPPPSRLPGCRPAPGRNRRLGAEL